MKKKEVAELFRHKMVNEIYHSSLTEDEKDTLVETAKVVEKEVLDTIKANRKSKS